MAQVRAALAAEPTGVGVVDAFYGGRGGAAAAFARSDALERLAASGAFADRLWVLAAAARAEALAPEPEGLDDVTVTVRHGAPGAVRAARGRLLRPTLDALDGATRRHPRARDELAAAALADHFRRFAGAAAAAVRACGAAGPLGSMDPRCYAVGGARRVLATAVDFPGAERLGLASLPAAARVAGCLRDAIVTRAAAERGDWSAAAALSDAALGRARASAGAAAVCAAERAFADLLVADGERLGREIEHARVVALLEGAVAGARFATTTGLRDGDPCADLGGRPPPAGADEPEAGDFAYLCDFASAPVALSASFRPPAPRLAFLDRPRVWALAEPKPTPTEDRAWRNRLRALRAATAAFERIAPRAPPPTRRAARTAYAALALHCASRPKPGPEKWGLEESGPPPLRRAFPRASRASVRFLREPEERRSLVLGRAPK